MNHYSALYHFHVLYTHKYIMQSRMKTTPMPKIKTYLFITQLSKNTFLGFVCHLIVRLRWIFSIIYMEKTIILRIDCGIMNFKFLLQ